MKNQLSILAALLVGAAGGYFLRPLVSAPDVEAPLPKIEKPPRSVSKISDRGDEATVAALRARISDLESELDEVADLSSETSRVEVAEDMPPPEAEPPKGPRPGSFSLKETHERMAKMKEEDPEGYARMIEGMKRWRQHRMNRAHEKVEFLSSVDTSTMTEAQRSRHERYQELIAKREDLESKMYDEELTDEEREKVRQEAVNTDHEMRWVGRQERNVLIDQTTQALGFQEEDARAVRDTLQQVLFTTDTGFMPPTPDR